MIINKVLCWFYCTKFVDNVLIMWKAEINVLDLKLSLQFGFSIFSGAQGGVVRFLNNLFLVDILSKTYYNQNGSSRCDSF